MKLQFSGKCGDLCSARLEDDDGNIIVKQDGCIPFGLGDGDYINFTLDLTTMTIESPPPTLENIQYFIDGNDQ